MGKRIVETIIVIFLILSIVGVVLASPQSKDCTSSLQAGGVLVELDANGQGQELVMLPNAYCGNYVAVATPQGNGAAVDHWGVDSSVSYALALTVQGQPGAAVWFHYIAAASYE